VCPDADAQLGPIWTPARRDEIAARLRELGGYHGPDAAQAVPRMVDDYARAWLAEHRQSCSFARGGARVQVTEAYLLDALFELHATLELLEQPDYALAIDARVAIAALPQPSSSVQLPDAALAELGSDVAIDVRRQLAAAHVRLRVGRGAESIAELESVIRRADAAGLNRLAARGRLELASALVQAGRPEAGQDAFGTAVAAAAAAEEHHVEIAGWLALADAAARRNDLAVLEHCDDRISALDMAHVFDRGSDIRVSSAWAIAGLLRGDVELAARVFANALHRAEYCAECDWRQVASLRNNLAVTYGLRGDHGSAAMLFERAAQLTGERSGAMHPSVALALRNLAISHHALGNRERADELWREVLRIQDAAVDPADTGRAARAGAVNSMSDGTLSIATVTMSIDEFTSAVVRKSQAGAARPTEASR
jgi:tetratricopeptide (TPR) repeat protein